MEHRHAEGWLPADSNWRCRMRSWPVFRGYCRHPMASVVEGTVGRRDGSRIPTNWSLLATDSLRAQEAAFPPLHSERVEVSDFSLNQFTNVRGPEATASLVAWRAGFVLAYPKRWPAVRTFHRVVPSLPASRFSRPTTPGWTPARMADAVAELMTANGYDRFLVSGGDIGSSVAEQLARRHPDRVIALHLTDVPYTHLFSVDPAELTEAERAYLAAGRQWQMSEGAYALIQSTKPTTAAVGLADSPAGLAAWIVEKLRSWSDCDGQLERRFSQDEVLTWVTLYWVTNTIGSSFIPYVEYEPGDDSEVTVPTGVTIFPKDLVTAPRDFAERFLQHRAVD